ncbi:MAG TPA: hypothetical protein VFJ15_04320 [Oleiagrimonas sp.]|nr:hypothetical protein [Oleiagrimonas sp.]
MRLSFPCVAGAVVLAAALVVSPGARAAHVSVVAGSSMTTHQLWTTSAFINVAAEKSFTWHGLHLQPVGTVGWIQGRTGPEETRANLDHDVFVAGSGLRLVDWWHGAFASFQVGIAAGRTAALSSAGQFISSVGWRGPHWMLMLRHISNGNIFGGENRGETMLMAGVRF